MIARWSDLVFWIVDVYAMATVVLAVALAIRRGLRQPARRLAVARWTLRVLLCLPPLALLARSPGPVGASHSLGTAGASEVCDCRVVGASGDGRMTTLAAGYAAGAGVVAAWLTFGALATARLAARTRAAPGSLQRLLDRVVGDGPRPPRLRVGGVSHPMVFGLFRPTIVLPEWFVATEPECRVEAALAHEWAHLRGGDLWTLATSRSLLVLFFGHPLFHVLRGRLRADQEVIADAEAAGPGGEVAYAEALVGWARRASCRTPGPSLPLLGRSSLLRERVALLLDADFRVERACPPSWMLMLRASAAVLIAVLGLLASTGAVRNALSAVVLEAPPAAPHLHPPAGESREAASPGRTDPSDPAVFRCCPADSA